MKNIIILCEPRTGSNVLCELFFSYNNFIVLNEFFTERIEEKLAPHYSMMSDDMKNSFYENFNIENKTVPGLIDFLNANPKSSLDFLDKLTLKYRLIKIHNFTFNDLNLSFLLDDPNTKFILLNRTSKIKQYVSNEVANQTQEWYNVDTSNKKIWVVPEKFLKFEKESLKWYSSIESKLIEKNHNFLKINYEEDLENIKQDQITLKISKWLTDNKILARTNAYKLSRYRKQNLSDLEHVILNYSQIKDFL